MVTPLFDTLAAFHLAHPGIDITRLEDNSDRLVERVRAGHMDVALIGAAGASAKGLNAMPVVSERLAATVPLDHPLARQRQAALADIAAYPIVCMPKGTGVRAWGRRRSRSLCPCWFRRERCRLPATLVAAGDGS
jgi:DNA-binding transcriptional LysR family regulator